SIGACLKQIDPSICIDVTISVPWPENLLRGCAFLSIGGKDWGLIVRSELASAYGQSSRGRVNGPLGPPFTLQWGRVCCHFQCEIQGAGSVVIVASSQSKVRIRRERMCKVLFLPLGIPAVEEQSFRSAERVKEHTLPLRKISSLEFVQGILARSPS